MYLWVWSVQEVVSKLKTKSSQFSIGNNESMSPYSKKIKLINQSYQIKELGE